MSLGQFIDTQLNLKLAQVGVIQFNSLSSDRNGFIFHVKDNIPELIKKLFSFSASKNEGAAALEEAITLTKFGQYNKALKEFQLLLKDESVRLAAAKNIIRCHMANHTFEDGVAQFREWMDADLFSEDQLGKTRAFFQSLLDKKGVDINLPDKAKDKSPAIEISADDADDGEEERGKAKDVLGFTYYVLCKIKNERLDLFRTENRKMRVLSRFHKPGLPYAELDT